MAGRSPDVIAGQADMLPPERGDVGQKFVGNGRALSAQLPNRPVEIDRVPVNDGGGDETETRSTEALVFEGTISDFALTMEEHRPPERVACLALVETRVAALTQRWVGVMALRRGRPTFRRKFRKEKQNCGHCAV